MASDAQDIADLKQQVQRLTEQVEALARHVGLGQLQAASPTDDPAIVENIRNGNLIMAIKLWRERTGAGLAESKDAVEALARRLGY